jgi:glycosyltransferase involved in cell wall biosynthesis
MVLFAFDMCSVMERKNPLGLVRAFRRAFKPTDDAVLVIKVTRGNFDPEGMALLRAEEAKGQMVIIDRVMSRAEAMALMACCDCYASLHRSEGFGLTLAEAMLLGKPAIGTNYSGNLDFMTPEVSRLVDFKKVKISIDLPQYPKGVDWAEPDEEHAGTILRELYERPGHAKQMAFRGQQHARSVLDPRAATSRVVESLRNM